MFTNLELHQQWREVLHSEFAKPYFKKLRRFVAEEYENETVYPKYENIFRAFNETPFDEVRVVILGQDPYHGPRQANGLSFSVDAQVKLPPSLVNIFKEINTHGYRLKLRNGDLTPWAGQGVFLLNATLTVRAGVPGSHHKKGWEVFTDAVVHALATQKKGIVYMLWGNYAQKKGALIPTDSNLVLKAVHPSPLSAYRGFLGCAHFKKANEYLIAQGKSPIEW